MVRREFLKLIPVAGIAAPVKKGIDEYDASNIKLCHRVSAKISDDDLLFLKQIGLRWARVEFGNAPASFEFIKATQERYGKYGIKIFSGVQYAYRELDVQLGRPGRDKHIETYRTFLRDLGRLGIGVSNYDFHPANTYTTAEVERRGY